MILLMIDESAYLERKNGRTASESASCNRASSTFTKPTQGFNFL
jgi:hypothetical protein